MNERLEKLRKLMKERHLDAYLVPTSDFHESEYVGEYFKCRKFLTGFTGSAGTAVVTADDAGMWTDGRYFVQAAKQLKDSGFTLQKMGQEGVPSINEYLQKVMPEGGKLGFDGRVINDQMGAGLQEALEDKHVTISYEEDLVGEIWENRPALSAEPVWILEEKYAGKSAAQKIEDLRGEMKKLHADVHVLMTENATNFINPITFETLTGNKCLVDTFDRNFQFQVEHVSIAKKADVVMIAPASANVIGKLAHGIADDMLTTTIMACKCKKFISPAMNTNMFENPVVQDNLKILEHYGYEVIAPACGYLACGDTGAGKMPEPETLLAYIEREAACEKDLKGKKILVTAGPTQESVDPVRYLTNHSSGKMGYAIAKAAMLRGADVTLVSGRTSIEPPMFVNLVPVVTARDMYEAVTSVSNEQDIIVKAAAVADYRPSRISEEKVKKSDGQMSIELERTDDILKFLGEHKRAGQFLCGFSMETQNVIDNSRAKLAKKNLDMVAANNVKVEGAGFQGDTNVLTLITQDEEISLPLMSKEDAAFRILDKILSLMQDSVC